MVSISNGTGGSKEGQGLFIMFCLGALAGIDIQKAYEKKSKEDNTEADK